MKVIQVSFFYKNNEPGGFGFSLGTKGFTPEQLTEMVDGPHVAEYMKNSSACLHKGPGVIREYYSQLDAIGMQILTGNKPPFQQVMLGALNILWLTKWGFMVQDEYNGIQIIRKVGP